MSLSSSLCKKGPLVNCELIESLRFFETDFLRTLVYMFKPVLHYVHRDTLEMSLEASSHLEYIFVLQFLL